MEIGEIGSDVSEKSDVGAQSYSDGLCTEDDTGRPQELEQEYWGQRVFFHNDQIATEQNLVTPSLMRMWTKNCQTLQFSSVQSLSRVQLFSTPWTAARQASLSITNSRSLPKFMSIESVMPSSHLILCRPLLLLPSIFPSIRVFSNESALCIRWPKYWSFSFNLSPSSEHSGLISFRMDCRVRGKFL